MWEIDNRSYLFEENIKDSEGYIKHSMKISRGIWVLNFEDCNYRKC